MYRFYSALRAGFALFLTLVVLTPLLCQKTSGRSYHHPTEGSQRYVSVSHVDFPDEGTYRDGFSGVVSCHATFGLHPAGVVRALVGLGFYQFKYQIRNNVFHNPVQVGTRPQLLLMVQPRIGRRANVQFGGGYTYYAKLSGGHSFAENFGMYTARAGFQLAALYLGFSYQTAHLTDSGPESYQSSGKILEFSLGCAF